jgi:hypothetical protein
MATAALTPLQHDVVQSLRAGNNLCAGAGAFEIDLLAAPGQQNPRGKRIKVPFGSIQSMVAKGILRRAHGAEKTVATSEQYVLTEGLRSGDEVRLASMSDLLESLQDVPPLTAAQRDRIELALHRLHELQAIAFSSGFAAEEKLANIQRLLGN